MRTVTRDNNTQIVSKPCWFVRNYREKLDELKKYWATCYATCNL